MITAPVTATPHIPNSGDNEVSRLTLQLNATEADCKSAHRVFIMRMKCMELIGLMALT